MRKPSTSTEFRNRIESCTFVSCGSKRDGELITEDGYKVFIHFELSTSISHANLISHVIYVSIDGKTVDFWGNDDEMLEWYKKFFFKTSNSINDKEYNSRDLIKDQWLSK